MQVFGQHEEQTLAQLARVAERADHAALMADGHLGYVMPIGGVAAYRNRVSVAGVGFDIACGNAAIRTDLDLDDLAGRPGGLRRHLERMGDELQSGISFGVGGVNRSADAPSDHPLFADAAWRAVPGRHRGPLLDKARKQLGSVGSGNHYVDVFADERDRIWVGVHFGSRGFGHTVASSFLAIGQGAEWGARVPEAEVILDLDAPAGHDYWHLMKLAGRYAYAGANGPSGRPSSLLGGARSKLCTTTTTSPGRRSTSGAPSSWCARGRRRRSRVRRASWAGRWATTRSFWRGAGDGVGGGRPAEGSAGLGGGVGGEWVAGACAVFHSAWRGPCYEPHGRAGEASPPHGQGAQARQGEPRDDGGVGGAEGGGAQGGGVDESPHVYRRLTDVLAAQGETVTVLHTLRPLVVVMAGGRW